MKNISQKNILGILFLILLVHIFSFGCVTQNAEPEKGFPSEYDFYGDDALSSSTASSEERPVIDFKINPVSGAAYITPPEINNFGIVSLRYPIEVTPGRKNINPDLSLVYSSTSSDGICGVGWSLAGHKYIISRSLSKGEPFYDSRDDFNFNGQKLIKVNGGEGEDGDYRLEIESRIFIVHI
jgi:hypothetical protein